jgi:hypothetical protein
MEQHNSGTVPASQAAQQRPERSLTGMALRVAVWVVTAQVALQPVFAGGFLDGDATAHGQHSANGTLLQFTALALLVTSILAWRPGRAPGRVAVAGSLMFLLLGLQVGFGYARFLSLHVPLGVASLVLMLWMLVSTRNRKTGPRDEQIART